MPQAARRPLEWRDRGRDESIGLSNSTSLFEFDEPGGEKRWVATPGKQTTFPLTISNETAEGQEVAVLVEDPPNWAWAEPHRLSLDPGDCTTVSIIFAPQRESMVAAGTHHAAIRLRDLEGVIFAECIKPFEVEERQDLAMTVSLRGPLMSFGMAEGFVLHCTLANRGNVDVAVTPVGEPHPTLTFSKRTVSVPFQGEVAFDIEVRWNAGRRNDHPETVTLRAPYRDGATSASIPWQQVADALEPFMPIYSGAEEDDELLSLSWLPQPGEDLLERKLPSFVPEEPLADAAAAPAAAQGYCAPPAAEQSEAVAAAGAGVPPQAVVPSRRSVMAPAKRVSPWWPVVQQLGGKWRVKPLPILMLIIGIEGFFLGVTEAQRDYYASPELRSPVPAFKRAFAASSHAASALVGFGEKAISETLAAGSRIEHHVGFRRTSAAAAPLPAIPQLWGLKALYKNPHTLLVSFNEAGCSNFQLIVASGLKIVYKKPVSGEAAIVPLPHALTQPLRITVAAQAPGGLELRQHVFMALPFALTHSLSVVR